MKITHLIMIVMMGLTSSVYGVEIEGVPFEERVSVEETHLSIRGVGLFRYLGFIKAYVGALYVAEGQTTQDVLSDTAKRLEIEYFHAVKGEDFGDATNGLIGRNVDAQTLENLRPRIGQHNGWYEDVQPGDRYSLTYVPGRGTELALNGAPRGLIPGEDFAFAVYAMWLGEKPMNQAFKRQLLGLQ